MRILVTGSAGMLGSSLVPALVANGHDVTATDIALDVPQPWGADGPTLHQLDVRSRDQIATAFKNFRPEFVAHLAAETSLEVCEGDPDAAWLTNTISTKYVALAARQAGIPMGYISTAGVFDGQKDGFYDEFDTPIPINVYGASKYKGEQIVAQTVPEHYIVRAGWMIGGGGKDHKFVSLMISQLDAGATTLRAVSDKLGTPTYTKDFAACFHQVITSDLFGLYHMTGNGGGSRYDVAKEILRILGRDDVELLPVASEYFAAKYFASRPPSEQMRNRVLDLQGMNTMRDWPVALKDYLETHFPDRIRVSGALLGS